jgi:hypothetical protein
MGAAVLANDRNNQARIGLIYKTLSQGGIKMRDNVITCDKFDFISIQEVKVRKAVNEHATFYIRGHVSEGNDAYVLRSSASERVKFNALDPTEGQKELFNGFINDIDMNIENDMSILTLSLLSGSALMDIDLKTRTFQDSQMTYKNVTKRMSEGSDNFTFAWPTDGGKNIGSMTAQYKETDWNYAKRLAGRLGTVVVPNYLLGEPYISIGMTNKDKPEQKGIDVISYSIKKGTSEYRASKPSGGYTERDAISYVVKSRDIFDLCDKVPFMGHTLFVYAIDTFYDGNELVHYYTLKEQSGFYTKNLFNEDLIGATLSGTVKAIQNDEVQVEVNGDVSQTNHKWFPYATPFTQPKGSGWYFMPEAGDEIRLQFPSEKEHDAYVSSATHITHGNRMDPEVKYIRTIYDQVIQFCPERVLIDDGSGSRVVIDKGQGITMTTDKFINVNAKANIVLSATGKIEVSGAKGVSLQKGKSVVNIDDMIDISSEHTRVQ